MNLMFDQILSLAGQLATWFTLVVVFLTLREMEKQRKSSQKPELIIPTVELRGLSTREENDRLLIPTEFSTKTPQIDNKSNFDTKGYPEWEVYNIGSGAAKNIEMTWMIDNIVETVEAIKNYCYQNSIPIVMKFESNSLDLELDGRKVFMPFGYKSTIVQRYHYILPASVTTSPLVSYFPDYLVHMLLPVVICLELSQLERNTPKHVNFFEFLSVKLEVKYEDISNTKYVKNYQLELLSVGYVKPVEKKLIKRHIYSGQLVFREN